MKAIAACLTFANLFATLAVAQSSPLPGASQVITGAELRAAGATRLTDIFMLVEDWDASTVDGFTSDVSARGLAPFGRQTWSVMLNGQPVDLSLFGVTSLNRLPVDISWIESVEIISVPQFHNAEFVRGGLIHIRTHRPDSGLSLRGRYVFGNEIGDPGPFRYTPLSTVNVTRLGPDQSLSIAYGGAKAYAELGFVELIHAATDEAIAPRTSSIGNGAAGYYFRRAYNARIGGDFLGGRHEAFYGKSSFNDYFFLRPYGREIPVINDFRHAGVKGSFRLAGRDRLLYRLAYDVNQLDQSDNLFDLDFDWTHRTLSALVEATRSSQRYQVKAGASVRRMSADTRYPLTADHHTIYKAHGEVAHRLTEKIQQRFGVAVAESNGNIGIDAFTHHRFRIDPRNAIDATVSYSRTLLEEDSRIWIWRSRGYDFLADAGVDITVDGELEGSRQFTADLSWSAKTAQSVELRFAGFFRWFSRVHLMDQVFSFTAADQSFASPVVVQANQSGQVAGGDVTLDWVPTPQLRLRSYYRYQDVVGGDRLLRDGWRSIPRHKIQGRVWLTPAPSFSLWGRLAYRSAVAWPAYQNADVETNGQYSAEINDIVEADLGLEKWFANKTLRLSLGLRNVLNQTVRSHPIGARFDLTAFLQGEMHFTSIVQHLKTVLQRQPNDD